MAACNGEELKMKWITELTVLRDDCKMVLKHKLLGMVEPMRLARYDGSRRVTRGIKEEILPEITQKLEALALGGRHLSNTFVNSLAVTFVRHVAAAATHARVISSVDEDNVPSEFVNTQDKRARSKIDDQDFRLETSSELLAEQVTPFPSKLATLVSQLTIEDARTTYKEAPANFSSDHKLPKDLQDVLRNRVSAQAQLKDLTEERIELDKRLAEERNYLGRRAVYLNDCRTAAEKEMESARKKLSTALRLLAAAEKERRLATRDKVSALERLKYATQDPVPLRQESQNVLTTNSFFRASFLEDKALEVPVNNCLGLYTPKDYAPQPLLHKSVSLPILSWPIITLTPPESPIETELNPGGSLFVATSSVDGHASSQFTSAGDFADDRQNLNAVTDSTSDISEFAGISTLESFENPIGPYIRPPMPLEDMQKCVRCLFGKDKSLKTGNRARAFLGLSWSDIVSFDPDVLLGRGVLGIRQGSTGMASRLRMMTIIESALSNQNDDTIPSEIWERPTHFCENCQMRYPITVSSNQAVLTFEEGEIQRKQDEASSATFMHKIQSINQREAREQDGLNSKSRRNKKRLRGTRPATQLLRQPSATKS
ncbi:hypothetical protein K439DRAFT_1662024 [Ramaria rubella]|nr:hypothetical protein K439DRAFT_1662024 [Ramaria rubella]